LEVEFEHEGKVERKQKPCAKDDKDSSEEKEAGKKGSETDDIPTMALSRFQEHFHIWKEKTPRIGVMWVTANSNDTRLESCSTTPNSRLRKHKIAVKGEGLGGGW
jgi:hypothetical protein